MSANRLGYLYLHREAKKLIWKHAHYEFEGDLVQKVWPIYTKLDAYEAIRDGAVMGAKNAQTLFKDWGFNEEEESRLKRKEPYEEEK